MQLMQELSQFACEKVLISATMLQFAVCCAKWHVSDTCIYVCMYMRMCVHAYVCTCICEHPGEELESCSAENGIMAWHTFKV